VPENPSDALAPVVTSVTPNTATVLSVGPSIVVSGNNFVSRSIVQLDGAPLATNFVSATELRATVPTAKLATLGVLRISVGTSPPGGGASREVTFEVQNPVATLTSLSPLSVLTNAPNTTLTASGANFVAGAKIVFGVTSLATTLTNATTLSAVIPSSLLVGAGSVPVKVVNPAPGGGDSSAIAFTVANPTAALDSINPSAAFVGSASIPMTVTGAGFVAGSSVVWNGTPLVTTFVSATSVRATVPAGSLGAAGDFPVAVANPAPGGGITQPVVFRVQYPSPQPSSVLPQAAPAGAGPTDVVVSGIGFFLTSQLTFDGVPAATVFQDATHLKATLSAAQLASAGTISVRVVNSAPGGGISSALPFSITNALPVIGSLAPASVTAGSADRVIALTGAGFVPTSTATSNGVLVATAYVGPTTLNVTVPANHMLNPGSIVIAVTNPAPGGGISAPKSLVVGCDVGGVDVSLGTLGAVTTLQTNFATAPLMSKFAASGDCAASSIDPAKKQPARYWVVQNTTGAPVTLSAWADCTASGKQDDALLTFYRRPTTPANDTERLACAFQIAEGVAVSSYLSPEAGVSSWCPGLTKANGGGLTLGVCEKAVVHIQAFDVANVGFPAPPVVRLKAE
jgi:hypothetical protein